MKKTFTTVDVVAIIAELTESVIGYRVNQIYDIDHKTYLIKLQKPDQKVVLLLESAARIHATEYEWPKSPAPSGFAMKLRKHLRNKRLESIEQLGVDRIVDLRFGSGEATHHLIVELYDRGNIVLTDGEYNILNVLRPRKEGEDTRIAVHQKYPVENARQARSAPSLEVLKEALTSSKENIPLKKILNPMLDCGGGMLDHELLKAGFSIGVKVGKEVNPEGDLHKLLNAIQAAQQTVQKKVIDGTKQGYIIKKSIDRLTTNGAIEEVFLFQEFHPRLYAQHADLPHEEFPSFNKACDEFFSKLEANELDKKVMQKEREALKKLENVKKDHEKRIQDLKDRQDLEMKKGQLIELNQQLVEGALLVVRSAIANQIDWSHIQELLDEAQSMGDPIACAIKALKLETNTMTLWVSDPYDCDANDMLLDSDEEREEGTESTVMRPMAVDINLDLSALANARSYFNMRRQAAKKEQKTIDASSKAIKSAEKKTHQTLKEVSTIASINKARKVHWFEKYLWFISSENYLVIGGRDSQQNEQVVKRHLRPKDVYVHADLHGAASVVVKNPTGVPVPPRTLHEAGIMALCYSRAWDEKVVTSAWWVWGQQVSKTAPAGEYLTTGAFMVRGRKNFLPPSHLVYGFGFLFRLEESSIERHEGERKTRVQDEEFSTAIMEAFEKLIVVPDEVKAEEELSLDDDDDDDGEGDEKISTIEEAPESEDGNEDDETELKDENLVKFSGVNEVFQEKVIEGEFPDTELELSYLTGDQFTLKAREASSQQTIHTSKAGEDEQSRIVYLGDDKPLILKHSQKITRVKQQKEQKLKDNEKPELGNEGKNMQAKRGQKGKMKKMKKYKNQDEEERELRMQLLQSGGCKKPPKKEKGKLKEKKPFEKKPVAVSIKVETKALENNNLEQLKTEEANEDEGEDEVTQTADDLSILSALTAVPVSEDELLYAVAVCAPYTSMTNYKYKVKLTPGPGKKGKATKTAVILFLADKAASVREKDLLKAIKDHDLARNIPGKVKVSAPNISKIKK